METATSTKSCASCAYWKSLAGTDGECRRQPPQAVSFTVDDTTKFEAKFPVTQSADWCGEFEAK